MATYRTKRRKIADALVEKLKEVFEPKFEKSE